MKGVETSINLKGRTSYDGSYSKTLGRMAVERQNEAINQDNDQEPQFPAKIRNAHFRSYVSKHNASLNYKQIYSCIFTTPTRGNLYPNHCSVRWGVYPSSK